MIAHVGKVYRLPEGRRADDMRPNLATTSAARTKRLGAAWTRGFVAGLTVGLLALAVGIVAWIIIK